MTLLYFTYRVEIMRNYLGKPFSRLSRTTALFTRLLPQIYNTRCKIQKIGEKI